ncbi:hypothetical protein KJ885_02485, partial [Patescibacteria group bacterium]|nr:hypothetical protein [Patescibacteria group bacterium]
HKKLLSISISIVSSVFLVALVVSAATTIGTNIVTGGTVTVGSNVLSDAHNTDTLGTVAVAWHGVYTSGTIYAGSVSSTGMSGWKDNDSDLGSPAVAWKNIYASGTIYVGTDVRPEKQNDADLGTTAVAWNDVFTSGTVYAETIKAHAAMAIGGGNETVAINSSDWDISATGVMSGIGNITTDGAYTQSGTGANTFTGDTGFISASSTAFSAQTDIFVGTTATTTIKGGASATSTFTSGVEVTEASATSTLHIGGTGVTGAGGCIALGAGTGAGILYISYDATTQQLVTSTVAATCY